MRQSCLRRVFRGSLHTAEDTLTHVVADFTAQFREEFHHDLDTLRVQEGNLYPLASDHVEDMVDLTRRLLERGFAYEKLRSVYFDISRFKDYGRLSRLDRCRASGAERVPADAQRIPPVLAAVLSVLLSRR